MKHVAQAVGYFVFSLDTELAWGTLNWRRQQSQKTTRNGETERRTIERLVEIMDDFGVVATWAITGHLFYGKCEDCEVCPVLELKDRDQSFEQIWHTNHPMWYGSDVVELLMSRATSHEIAFHGYTHKRFGDLTSQEAQVEVDEWLRLARRKNIVPTTVIFPQGSISHLDVFREAAFTCYRGHDVPHPVFSIPGIGKAVRRLNGMLSVLPPRVYTLPLAPSGLVNLPSSQWLFRTNRRIEASLDWLNLQRIRFYGTVKAIDRAARESKIIHLWAHPHEFQTEKDFDKLRFVFGRFAKHANNGRLESITMADLARKSLQETSLQPHETVCAHHK